MIENFMKGSYGVFVHYLVKHNNKDVTSEEWNEQTSSFDARTLAKQLHEMGAKWLFFTMGQASGHFAAPNSVIDEITGNIPSKCSTRDIPLELYDALAPYGIRLCLYISSEGCNLPNFGWKFLRKYKTGNTEEDRQADFQRKWERVMTEWSKRYGNKISAWWIDACYFPDEMYNFDDEPNFHSFAKALRAGNPDAMLAFNNGKCPPVSMTDEDDYTAGEIFDLMPIAFDRFPLAVFTPKGKFTIDDSPLQYHLLCSLGRDWGHLVKTDEPRFPDGLVCGYTEYILSKGGAMTWEVPIGINGIIDETYVRQLKYTKEYLAEHGL